MTATSKIWGRFFTSLQRRAARPITPGRAIGFVVTVGAVGIVATCSTMPEGKESWLSRGAWVTALAASWPAVLCAIYLKYSEKYKYYRVLTQSRQRNWIRRRVAMSRAISELGAEVLSHLATTSPAELKRVRHDVLECAVLSVRDALAIPDDEDVVACLLDFCGPDFKSKNKSCPYMYVSASSSGAYAHERKYERNRLIANKAIDIADILSEHDLLHSESWSAVSNRRYRSVIAVPITRGDRAYGALSIDSSRPYAFVGRSMGINLLLQPYLAVLALTYPIECPARECPYDAG